MAEEAGYAIDWIDKKITEDHFREIVIGEQNVHYTIDRLGNYLPISPKFSEKEHADYFLTGSYEPKYPQYWLARVRKDENLFKAWEALNKDAEEIGKYDPLAFAPALVEMSKYKQSLSIKFMDELANMIADDKSSAEYNNFLKDWKKSGGSVSHSEVNTWYKDNK